ncbi:MAG: copper resistance protein NlpE [Gemmatimonadota bacterium]|nr:copper resistance protein NlpE [Gemmatimonadota bacterium]
MAALGCCACGPDARGRDEAQTEPAAVTDSVLVVGAYTGTLPCADCAGIVTELTLYATPGSGIASRYDLKETYLATAEGDRTVSAAGQWAVLRGSASDSTATVYQLNPENPAATRSYERVDDMRLRQLDREGAEIGSGRDYTLIRTDSGPPRDER